MKSSSLGWMKREASLSILLVGRFVSMLLRKFSLESSTSLQLSSASSLVLFRKGFLQNLRKFTWWFDNLFYNVMIPIFETATSLPNDTWFDWHLSPPLESVPWGSSCSSFKHEHQGLPEPHHKPQTLDSLIIVHKTIVFWVMNTVYKFLFIFYRG